MAAVGARRRGLLLLLGRQAGSFRLGEGSSTASSTSTCLRQFVRHVRVNGSEVKAGNVIERKGRLFEVVSAHHAQQGRGSANVQVELRDVLDGSKFTERLRPSESVERIRLEEQQRTYLYHEGDAVHVMHPDTFEQVALPRSMFGEAAAFLQEGMPVTVSIHDEDVVQASVPPQVTCTVRETDPYAKGQTAKPSYKPAVLTNGLTVQVPAFIGVGDQVVIDTRDQSFARRHKDES